MHIIFVTSLLVARFDRASRRRSTPPGWAKVWLILAFFALLGISALAIDGWQSYQEGARLQKAADMAALAGVGWLPSNRSVADTRAQLAAETKGVSVSCYYNSVSGATAPQRCQRASLPDLAQHEPGSLYYFESNQPQYGGSEVRYSVKITTMQSHFLLGWLGFPAYSITRSATAAYTPLATLGTGLNYYGTSGALYDHSMRCDLPNAADCSGTGNNLDMRGLAYQRYVMMRCEQPNPPSPCIGAFWGHIAGPNLFHSNGDAYTPIKDGATSKSTSFGPLGGIRIGSGSPATACLHTSDVNTWFVNAIFSDPNKTSSCTNKDANGYPLLNYDRHPDSPNQIQGFGYELGIEVDPAAIYSYSETQANLANHTNLNVTIFDGAESDLGSGESFSTADNYQGSGSLYGTSPFGNFAFQNQLAPTSTWQSKQLICSPGTTAFSCNPTAQSGSNPTPARITNTNTFYRISQLFPDTNNLELTYNDIRTRLSLYGPPASPSTPSTYSNVSGLPMGSFEMTDMSVRATQNGNVQQPIENASDYRKYCYIIFDDVKAFWNNTRNTGAWPNPYSLTANNYPSTRTSIAQTTGTGPDYAYAWNSGNGEPNYGTPVQQNNRYAYGCPAQGTSPADYRWNQLKGTPIARYGYVATLPASGPRTIQQGILDSAGSQITVAPNDIAANPIVTSTIGGNFGTNTSSVDPSQQGVSSIWAAPNASYKQAVDPSQDCRKSVVDRNDWPLDPLWGHNRLPYNLAYGDPLVNRAWITGTTNVANPVALGRIAGYYTIYYSFHGWRCDWDFDGNYTLNPKQDPTNPNAPSLSQGERTLGAQDQWDRAFTLGHPGLSSNAHLSNVLQNQGANAAAIARETVPVGSSGMDVDYGLEPYFHLTNIGWVNGNLGPSPGLTDENAPVRPGTYMVQIQTFGGSGANRYSVKAEYENPKPITYTLNNTVVTITPVPKVNPITAMALYTNLRNNGLPQKDAIFDLAFIPPEYAGTQAVVELWDTGDVAGTGTMGIQILKPSRYGPKVITNGSNDPTTWQLPVGDPLRTRLTVCPYSLQVDSAGLNANCYTDSFANTGTTQYTYNSSYFYNDEWMILSFTLPNVQEYQSIKQDCETHGVPENLCYYFQLKFKLVGPTMVANDTTTWQLAIQGQPAHIVIN